MASGHEYRANRPNTWLLRPLLQSEDSSCQPGAVHTWPNNGLMHRRHFGCNRSGVIGCNYHGRTEMNELGRQCWQPRCRRSGWGKLCGNCRLCGNVRQTGRTD
jgi:hypothetical protein